MEDFVTNEIAHGDAASRAKLEAKNKASLANLGLKKVDGISRAVVRRGRNQLVVLTEPLVFKAPNTNAYILFGEPSLEDPSAAFASAPGADTAPAPAAPQEAQEAPAPAAAPADNSEVPADVDAQSIETVLSQAPGKSRAEVAAALKKHDGDLVNAILELQ